MIEAAARHILGDPSGHLFQGHGTQILPGARAHGQLPGLDFPIACDEQVRDTLQRVLADFIADLFVPQRGELSVGVDRASRRGGGPWVGG